MVLMALRKPLHSNVKSSTVLFIAGGLVLLYFVYKNSIGQAAVDAGAVLPDGGANGSGAAITNQQNNINTTQPSGTAPKYPATTNGTTQSETSVTS